MRRNVRTSFTLPFSDGKLTKRARRSLELAQDEARRLRHDYVGTEHILLGLIGEADGVAAVVLRTLTSRPIDVREAIETIVAPGDSREHRGDMALTPRAKRALELAVEEGKTLGHRYLGTEHILLGLIREGEGIAAGVLQSLGIGLDDARQGVIRVLASMGPNAPPETKGHVITCRVDARDLDAIDALVESGVRSTRSDAASWLIHAGIDSNREILDRVYGTVAEIRRLREEVARTLSADGGESSDEAV